jgi:hypothetical protein
METKNPRTGQGAGASVSIAADTEASTRNHLNLQPLDLARYRALHIASRFAVTPELAVALAAVAFGGSR